MSELNADVAIIGGGLGGVAAALAALKLGRSVILTEETKWLGGQLTSQGTPPDENNWIETHGATTSYRSLRNRIRRKYLDDYPVSELAKTATHLNPGMGSVSPLCCEPRVAVGAIADMLGPWFGTGRLTLLMNAEPIAVETDGDHFRSVTVMTRDDGRVVLSADYFIDATELGDLLELGSVEHVIGAEGQAETGEPSAPSEANPMDQQAISWCFAVYYREGEDHTIDRPGSYNYWSDYQASFWPDKQLSFTAPHPVTLEADTRPLIFGDTAAAMEPDRWHYRRLLYRKNFVGGAFASDICLVNWPQIDYIGGPIVGVPHDQAALHRQHAKDLSASFLYWMQTEAPRHDGGYGYRELEPAGAALGTLDGFTIAPYIRESRRIKARFTVTENHVGYDARSGMIGAEAFDDSVGIGSYRIDLHPSTAPRNFVDIPNWPFQIPLGALIPKRVRNLLPACKNIGSTHITNGCYRLHPVEWNIGEVAGALTAFCMQRRTAPEVVHDTAELLRDFQDLLVGSFGVELEWPREIRESPRLELFGDTK